MRQLIVAEFISLDGVIQAPGGPDEDTEGGFTQGGWTWPYWLDGSSELVHTLTHDELVDEYVLHVYPVVLGGGKRLFPTGTRHNLQLVETAALPTGVVFMRYRRAG